MTHKIRVGITHGDINGIGYETILKAFSQPTLLELCTPIVYGSDQQHKSTVNNSDWKQRGKWWLQQKVPKRNNLIW